MRLLLAGGGTGGHLFPAVALAEQLREEEPASEVLFVGTEQGLEARLLPELGLPLKTIEMSGWAGLGLQARLKALANLFKGLGQAGRILKDFQPQVVVGVGGYASVPVLLGAKKMGVPYLIHEQNAWPGLANRLLGRWAQTICLSYQAAADAFPGGRTVVTGNPIRSALRRCPALEDQPPALLVFGGSHGARAINRAVLAALPYLQQRCGDFKIIHQTGRLDFDEVLAGYRSAGWDNVEVQAFINDMATAYQQASLVVCRAGATTLAELTACGRPAILVPYPHATGRHQSINARALADQGAAIVIEQADLTPDALGRQITDLLAQRERLQAMAAAARQMARPEAAASLLQECRKLAGATG